MKLKATVRNQDSPVSEQRDFPCLMRSKNSDNLIVLFTSLHAGFVVSGNAYNNFKLGESSTWTPCSNTEVWEPFYGTVTLEQLR